MSPTDRIAKMCNLSANLRQMALEAMHVKNDRVSRFAAATLIGSLLLQKNGTN